MARQKPLLVRARIEHPDGTFEIKTVRADSIQDCPEPRHAALTDAQRLRATGLWDRIGRHVCHDIAPNAWMDRFRYDVHIDRELDHWEHAANVFDHAGARNLTRPRRETVLWAIILIGMSAVDIESQTGLPEQAVNQLRQIYLETPGPTGGWHPDIPAGTPGAWDVSVAVHGNWRERHEPLVEAIREADGILVCDARTAQDFRLYPAIDKEDFAGREQIAVLRIVADMDTDDSEIILAAVYVIKGEEYKG